MSRSGWSFSRVSTRKWSRVDLLSLHRKLTLTTRTPIQIGGSHIQKIMQERRFGYQMSAHLSFVLLSLGRYEMSKPTLCSFLLEKKCIYSLHTKTKKKFIIYINKMTYLPVFMILPMRRIISKSFPNFLDFLTWEKLISLISNCPSFMLPFFLSF